MIKKIIPCLDIKDGRTVKGINFVGIRDAGDPVEMAQKYVQQGADELVFLDIAATVENRSTMVEWVKKVAAEVSIPFTVGGGVNSVEDAQKVLDAGADKISINSSAVTNPMLINEIAEKFGSKSLVLAIDTKYYEGESMVYTHGGNTPTLLKAVEWAQQGERLGAGEILLTSMNSDGTKDGFALDITAQVCDAVKIPVTASGGAGSKEHFADLFLKTGAASGLAASIFHFGEVTIPELKSYLKTKNIEVK